MKASDPQTLEDLLTPAAVYLLQRRDGLRFKIGWSLEPVVRVQRLPEFLADALDLAGSHAMWLPTPRRARQVERALHRSLATYRVLPGHSLDGHIEWFLPAAHRAAIRLIRLIRQMPIAAEASLPPSMVGFLSEPADRLLGQADDADSAVVVQAQDTLWVMQDLLLRVSACCSVAVERAADGHAIRLIGFRVRVSGALDTLRWAVLDINRYRWRTAERTGSLVQLMTFEGSDLELQVTPMRQIRTWADGALVWQVLALLERLRTLAGRPESLAETDQMPQPARGTKAALSARRGAP
jgi:hypothetical protein